MAFEGKLDSGPPFDMFAVDPCARWGGLRSKTEPSAVQWLFQFSVVAKTSVLT